MTGIVDRIENNIVVIEIDDKMYNVDISLIQGEVLEGDVVDIELDKERIVNVKKNNSKTKSREEYIKEITKDMWE